MRIWHYKLIPVLPQKMLVSQWRELVAIKRQWEKGTLIHPLVSYVKNKNYNTVYFGTYMYNILKEMQKRGIKYSTLLYSEMWLKYDFIYYDNNGCDFNRFGFYHEHNDEYLEICYFNLKEKYLRGIISQDEWQKIATLYKEELYVGISN